MGDFAAENQLQFAQWFFGRVIEKSMLLGSFTRTNS